MGHSPYLNEQQAEAPPPRKYELPEEDPKAGLLRRFSVGLLLSGVFVLLKDVLFNWSEPAAARTDAARADSGTIIDPGNGRTEPPSLAVVEAPEAVNQGESEPQPKPNQKRASSPSAPIDSYFTIEQPLVYAEPGRGRASSGPSLAATNDNQPADPSFVSDVNDLPTQFGGATAGSGGGNNSGESDDSQDLDGDVATDSQGLDGDDATDSQDLDGDVATGDPSPTGNRAPVVSGPARLKNLLVNQTGNRAPVVAGPARLDELLVNQTVIIAAAGLLQNATDADGDVLSIQNLAASSGNLVETGTGTWSFTPDLNDTTEVSFTYNVTDGTESTPQTAVLDLLPLPGKTFIGTDGPDTIIGTPSSDIIDAGGGDDILIAREGKDTIYGGDGDDRILAGEGNDVIFGGAGDDTIFGGGGDDVIFGGDGDDTIFGGDGSDVILGGNGQDLIVAGAGDDIVEGGKDDDRFVATVSDGDDSYSGGAGIDTYDLSKTDADAVVDLALGTANSAQTGSDSLTEIENVIGGAGDDTIVGSDANNVLQGESGSDNIDGGAGDDIFIATISDGDDFYSGGAGTDTYDLSGTEAGVVVDLTQGTADGAEIGHDDLTGIENVVGGAGDDVFKANEFLNVFTGGEGNDIFEIGAILDTNAIRAVRDQITDFDVGDKIDLSGFDTIWTLAGNPDIELVLDKLDISDSGKVEFRFEGFGEDERTVVEGKIDEDGALEFEIELYGRYDLTKDDFIGVT